MSSQQQHTHTGQAQDRVTLFLRGRTDFEVSIGASSERQPVESSDDVKRVLRAVGDRVSRDGPLVVEVDVLSCQDELPAPHRNWLVALLEGLGALGPRELRAAVELFPSGVAGAALRVVRSSFREGVDSLEVELRPWKPDAVPTLKELVAQVWEPGHAVWLDRRVCVRVPKVHKCASPLDWIRKLEAKHPGVCRDVGFRAWTRLSRNPCVEYIPEADTTLRNEWDPEWGGLPVCDSDSSSSSSSECAMQSHFIGPLDVLQARTPGSPAERQALWRSSIQFCLSVIERYAALRVGSAIAVSADEIPKALSGLVVSVIDLESPPTLKLCCLVILAWEEVRSSSGSMGSVQEFEKVLLELLASLVRIGPAPSAQFRTLLTPGDRTPAFIRGDAALVDSAPAPVSSCAQHGTAPGPTVSLPGPLASLDSDSDAYCSDPEWEQAD